MLWFLGGNLRGHQPASVEKGVGGPKVVLSLGAVLPTRSEIPARRVEEKVAKRRLLEKRDVERSEIT